MVKFLFVGDLHLRGTNPRNRIDDYKEVAKQKLKEVFKIAVDNAVDAILQPGDIFDRPEVGIAVLLEFAEVLKESPVNIYCTLGNHDIYGYNVDSYYRTSLRLLEMLVPQLTVIRSASDKPIYLAKGHYKVYLTAMAGVRYTAGLLQVRRQRKDAPDKYKCGLSLQLGLIPLSVVQM